MYFVYIVECKDKTLYTGITTDPERRLKEHEAGTASRYTRSRGARRMVYIEPAASRSIALRREHAIKALPRQIKLTLSGTKPRKKC